MATAIVPAQHALLQATRSKQAEDALHVGDVGSFAFIIAFLRPGHSCKEGCWRQLPLVADHHNLFRPRDGAKRIHRLDLRSLVHDKEIEGQPCL